MWGTGGNFGRFPQRAITCYTRRVVSGALDLRRLSANNWRLLGGRALTDPYTIYQSKLPPVDHPVVQGMFANRLGVTCFVPTARK